MQGTRVRALVQEDPSCRGATKPVRHNKRSHRNEKPTATREKARAQQRRPNAADKLINFFKKERVEQVSLPETLL